MSRGFYTLFRRETLRFVYHSNQTLLPPVVNLALYLLVFGWFLGARIHAMHDHAFITFIFPGLILMGSTVAAFQNSATSLFISRWEHFMEDLLVAPLSFAEMVTAFMLAAAVRGILVGILSLGAGFLFIDVQIAHPILFFGSLVLTSVCFACVGILNGLFAKRWDHIAVFQNYIVMPLVFLGGVFYPTDALPAKFVWINHANPLFYMVSALRHAYLGSADIPFSHAVFVTGMVTVAFFLASIELFRRGYNLRT